MAQGAYLEFNLPSEIGIYDESEIERSCRDYTVSGFTNLDIYCRVRAGSRFNIFYGFKNADTTTDPPTLIFQIPGLTNPRTTLASSPFDMTIYDGNNDVLY